MGQVLSSCPRSKRRLAAAARGVGAIGFAQAIERRRPALRIVNLHSVPARFERAFARLVHELGRTWRLGSPSDLPPALDHGVERPTLLFCFDDGLANTATSAATILEDAGGRAIFAVPAAWPDIPPPEQARWFQRHVYPIPTELHSHENDVSAAGWDVLADLVARGHEVWSHGVEHVELRQDTADDVLEREIVGSKLILEQRLGTNVRGYCPPVGYRIPKNARAWIANTYELSFGGRPAPVRRGGDKFMIPRSNIEASWHQSAVEFQLSPLGDLVSRALEVTRS